ncbi:MAG TPA: pepsin/retropepsin-like aspartic protease family protein [Rhizomicrobium sp.]|nr:pepsin/retropepsin-like aspartic protease family protein [Rhizomicrobium sp.]
MFVPVRLQGRQEYMLLDTGGALDQVTPQIVAALHLPTYRTPTLRFYDLTGNYTNAATVVPDFAIGNLIGHDVNFVIMPDDSFGGRGYIAGILGPGILRYYDVAIDFGTKTLTLLSQDHCTGRVIYWPAPTVAVIPMQVQKASGHIVVPVTLDGRRLNALLDTGAYTTLLNLSAAENDFGLDVRRAGLMPVGRLGGRDNPMIYRHRFASLSFGGVTVANPMIDVIRDLAERMGPRTVTGTRVPDVQEELPDLLIGMDILRHLHLYIAYGEQKLYITPASAPAAAPR